jgi:CheY-like chemotaxis protein
MEDSQLLKISEVAELASVLPSTIRHYTDIGLLRVAGYTDGGHRLYSREETLDRISRIQALSRRGLKLPEIKAELESRTRVRKVLVIDDELELVDLVSDLLKFKFPDWQVKAAMDGFTAGRMVGEFLPDLVILDLMLPGVDGFAICRQIRKDPTLKSCAVLAITGFDSKEMRDKIMACGANDYLAKPMETDALLEKVTRLMDLEDGSSKATVPSEISK